MPPDTPPASSEADDRAETLVRGAATVPDGQLPLLSPVRSTVSVPVPSAPRAPQVLPAEQIAFASRYVLRDVIGAGGMGEVRLCRDLRIGRDVALKIVKPGTDAGEDVRARFVREARLQGQLEHPSIVPVYDLGAAREGEWFTMKRVRGVTLEQVLNLLARRDDDARARFGTRKLLALFVQVCHAIGYAHARGVVHRDLKPSNVMFGDHGEVYVLDWGVAKVLGTADVAVEDDDDVPTQAAAQTMTGVVMGTPGYMSPEQARGRIDEIDARTDVYALGAMLFELLTLEPLHPLHTVEAAMQSIRRGADARPSARAPDRDPPPELDAICVRATAMNREERFADAAALAAAVERFLEGDRDLALRRAMAEEQIEEARRILSTSDGDADAHAAALRALHRAYALDPTNEVAVRAMARLLLRPPTRLPKEAEEELARDEERDRRATARDGSIAFLAWFALSPLWMFAGMRNLPAWGAIIALVALSAAIAGWVALRKASPTDASAWALLVASTAAIALATTYLGPFVLVPGWACQNTMVFAMYGRGARRWAISLVGTLAIVVPLGLELLSLVPPSFRFEGGHLVLLPRMVDIPALPTVLLLGLGNVAMVLLPSFIVGRLRDQAVDTKRALVAHLSRLRQLVPDEARGNDPS